MQEAPTATPWCSSGMLCRHSVRPTFAFSRQSFRALGSQRAQQHAQRHTPRGVTPTRSRRSLQCMSWRPCPRRRHPRLRRQQARLRRQQPARLRRQQLRAPPSAAAPRSTRTSAPRLPLAPQVGPARSPERAEAEEHPMGALCPRLCAPYSAAPHSAVALHSAALHSASHELAWETYRPFVQRAGPSL